MICDNGENPSKLKNQLKFSSPNDKGIFGWSCIFKPNSGRLAYGKGRIAV